MQDASLLEALPSAHEDQALLADGQAGQHCCDMQPQLIAAQHLPDTYRQQFQQPLPAEAHRFQSPSRLPKPLSVVAQSQVQVNQPCSSSDLSIHDQPSNQHVNSQQQVHAPLVASAGMLNGRDQYEVLRLQSSLIPRQSNSSLTVPSQAQLSPGAYQAMAQPQLVQSVTHKSAFAASAISCQTPEAVSASQSTSEHESVTVQHSSGHAITNSRQRERQHSMHRQLNEDEVTQGNDAVTVPDQGIRAEQEQSAIVDRKFQSPYVTQWQGFQADQQQPYSVAATRQQRLTEHTVSRSPDGNSVTESQTVSSSSSHYEFSFRRDISSSALPRSGTSFGTFACRADCCDAALCCKDIFVLNPQSWLIRLLLTDSTTCQAKM